jgi:arylsulfatase A-like enzyme
LAEGLLFETRASAQVDPVSLHRTDVWLRPVLLLAALVACFSLQVELVVLEQVDSLSLYMTYGEIALDVGVALLILLGIAGIWWLCVLVLAGTAKLVPLTRPHRIAIAWYVGLLVPFSYLLLDLFGAIKALIFPHWQTGWFAGLLVFLLCVGVLWRVRVSQLQEFCRTRLVPIAWAHVILAVITVCVLWADGVHLFHDYVRPGAIAGNSQMPDIYLVTLDALAAQDTSLYGYHLPTTPRLEWFAKRSFKFDYFFANSNFTASSTTSMETGKLPWSHRVFQQGGFLRGEAQQENIAAELHRRGYYTAMITSNEWAAPFRHRTLDSYDAVQYEAPLGMAGEWSRYTNLIGVNVQYTLYGSLFRRLMRVLTIADALVWPHRYPAPAEAVLDRARKLVQDTHHAQPRFIWTHILPPHDPYLPPVLTRKRFLSTNKLASYEDLLPLRSDVLPPGVSAGELRARYDEMVLYADTAVGDFLDWLDRTGRLDRAIVIVSADHGESFEHGTFLHAGPFLYESMIQVPLLIHLPDQTQGAHISQLAQQADLLPTILDLVGAPAPSWTDGTSLQSAMKGDALPERFIFSMNLEPDRTFGSISKGTVAVRDDEFKYVLRLNLQKEALYQYKADPLEEHNLITTNPEVARRLREVLLNKLKEVNGRSIGKP